ncbi:MAG: hypothetical protein E7658_07755 [Ruminococcaceae bacterium]|nr:hypothetical protein [Oscillospiraceae bacterium]
MKDLIKTFDSLPLIVKIILAIPALDIVWWIYRICRSLDKNNILGVVIAVVLLLVGIPFMWVVDIICILLKGSVFWID